MISWTSTVNMDSFAGRSRENVGKTVHVGILFTISLLVPYQCNECFLRGDIFCDPTIYDREITPCENSHVCIRFNPSLPSLYTNLPKRTSGYTTVTDFSWIDMATSCKPSLISTDNYYYPRDQKICSGEWLVNPRGMILNLYSVAEWSKGDLFTGKFNTQKKQSAKSHIKCVDFHTAWSEIFASVEACEDFVDIGTEHA